MNTLIRRCLVHGVKMYPHQQDIVIAKYEKTKIPDEALSNLSKQDLTRYVKALYLCSLEMAGDWTEGFNILEDLGFKRLERQEGHRVFISMIYALEAKA